MSEQDGQPIMPLLWAVDPARFGGALLLASAIEASQEIGGSALAQFHLLRTHKDEPLNADEILVPGGGPYRPDMLNNYTRQAIVGCEIVAGALEEIGVARERIAFEYFRNGRDDDPAGVIRDFFSRLPEKRPDALLYYSGPTDKNGRWALGWTSSVGVHRSAYLSPEDLLPELGEDDGPPGNRFVIAEAPSTASLWLRPSPRFLGLAAWEGEALFGGERGPPLARWVAGQQTHVPQGAVVCPPPVQAGLLKLAAYKPLFWDPPESNSAGNAPAVMSLVWELETFSSTARGAEDQAAACAELLGRGAATILISLLQAHCDDLEGDVEGEDIDCLDDFKMMLFRKYGNVYDAWRKGLAGDDGVVKKRDFESACQRFSVQEAFVESLWKEIDASGDGSIALYELDGKFSEDPSVSFRALEAQEKLRLQLVRVIHTLVLYAPTERWMGSMLEVFLAVIKIQAECLLSARLLSSILALAAACLSACAECRKAVMGTLWNQILSAVLDGLKGGFGEEAIVAGCQLFMQVVAHRAKPEVSPEADADEAQDAEAKILEDKVKCGSCGSNCKWTVGKYRHCGDMYECDICKDHESGSRWHCLKCSYDVCPSCGSGRQAESEVLQMLQQLLSEDREGEIAVSIQVAAANALLYASLRDNTVKLKVLARLGGADGIISRLPSAGGQAAARMLALLRSLAAAVPSSSVIKAFPPELTAQAVITSISTHANDGEVQRWGHAALGALIVASPELAEAASQGEGAACVIWTLGADAFRRHALIEKEALFCAHSMLKAESGRTHLVNPSSRLAGLTAAVVSWSLEQLATAASEVPLWGMRVLERIATSPGGAAILQPYVQVIIKTLLTPSCREATVMACAGTVSYLAARSLLALEELAEYRVQMVKELQQRAYAAAESDDRGQAGRAREKELQDWARVLMDVLGGHKLGAVDEDAGGDPIKEPKTDVVTGEEEDEGF
mmetsp:Transcript_48057/g.85266  ORF Transcript_48057/g.85266 Transcript_48057/m.85266 type:complete len:961 (+) Transcript_48057:250-3132(+)